MNVKRTRFTKASRQPWRSGFPKVPFSAKLGEAEKHHDYQAAKAGNVEAGMRLVFDLVSDNALEDVRDLTGRSRPLVVTVIAEESTGLNMIPLAYAAKIAKTFKLDLETEIVQSVRAHRTSTGADYRLANQPEFVGVVAEGKDYLVVDDTMTMGGTLAELIAHIESNGGYVIGATTLTGFGGKGQLALAGQMKQAVWQKHGESLNEYLYQRFGYGIDSLTQGEAGHYRKAVSLDAIRDRILAAKRPEGS